MEHIRLDWQQINLVQLGSLQAVLRSHEAVFQGGLGALEGYQARILVDPDATPRFSKACSVPYAYRELVEKELDHLASEGILEPVEFSEWASPIVPVLKSDKKSVRVCGGLSILSLTLTDTLIPGWRICSHHSLGRRCFQRLT